MADADPLAIAVEALNSIADAPCSHVGEGIMECDWCHSRPWSHAQDCASRMASNALARIQAAKEAQRGE